MWKGLSTTHCLSNKSDLYVRVSNQQRCVFIQHRHKILFSLTPHDKCNKTARLDCESRHISLTLSFHSPSYHTSIVITFRPLSFTTHPCPISFFLPALPQFLVCVSRSYMLFFLNKSLLTAQMLYETFTRLCLCLVLIIKPLYLEVLRKALCIYFSLFPLPGVL